MSSFLIRSLVLSAVLTILLNVFLVWHGRRATGDVFGRQLPPPGPQEPVNHDADAADRPSVQVFVPWKAMLIGSIGLTVMLNLVAWLAR